MTKPQLIAEFQKLRELYAEQAEECQIVLVQLAQMGEQIRGLLDVSNKAAKTAAATIELLKVKLADETGEDDVWWRGETEPETE